MVVGVRQDHVPGTLRTIGGAAGLAARLPDYRCLCGIAQPPPSPHPVIQHRSGTLDHWVPARLIELAHRYHYTTHQLDHSLRRGTLLGVQRRFQAEKLRFGQERRERVVHLVLDESDELPQLRQAANRVPLRGIVGRLCVGHRLTIAPQERYLNIIMIGPSIDPTAALAAAAESYRLSANTAALLAVLDEIARASTADALIAAVEPYRDVPEIVGPIYEHIVAQRPDNAHAMVILANAYWLSGRGPEAVQELATRAISVDPDHRGAWHLWALAESDPRARTTRWQQVSERFPADDLARANLADNAAALAGAAHDRDALALALRTYQSLLVTSTVPEQRAALEQAISTLSAWRL